MYNHKLKHPRSETGKVHISERRFALWHAIVINVKYIQDDGNNIFED